MPAPAASELSASVVARTSSLPNLAGRRGIGSIELTPATPRCSRPGRTVATWLARRRMFPGSCRSGRGPPHAAHHISFKRKRGSERLQLLDTQQNMAHASTAACIDACANNRTTSTLIGSF
jgi:hypothetical protein